MIDFYNRFIVAGWYRSMAIWVAIIAAASPYIIDFLAMLLDNWSVLSGVFDISDAKKEMIRLLLLIVVLPAARAFKQKSMEQAAAKQAALVDVNPATTMKENP